MRSASPSLYVRRMSASVLYSGILTARQTRYFTTKSSAAHASAIVNAIYRPVLPGSPNSSSSRSSSRHSVRTLTCRSRKTRALEEPLELLARGRADPLDHLAGAPDDDRLLRLALDEDRAVEPHDPLLVRLLELVDHHRGRERQLGVGELRAPARAPSRRRRSARAGRSGSRSGRAARLRAGAPAAPARGGRRSRRSAPTPGRCRRTRAAGSTRR